MLERGSRGDEVKDLQMALKEVSYYQGKIDGIFGALTEQALKGWQSKHYATGKIYLATASLLASKYVLHPYDRRELERVFGHIEYRDRERGWVTVTNDWAKKNIARVYLPIVGRKAVHYRLVGKFTGALEEIEDAGLAKEIKQFGTWACRHICNDPTKPLSLHSYGIAVDINWKENPRGKKECKLHRGIIEAFVRQGFRWGGAWRSPDNHHFEYYR